MWQPQYSPCRRGTGTGGRRAPQEPTGALRLPTGHFLGMEYPLSGTRPARSQSLPCQPWLAIQEKSSEGSSIPTQLSPLRPLVALLAGGEGRAMAQERPALDLESFPGFKCCPTGLKIPLSILGQRNPDPVHGSSSPGLRAPAGFLMGKVPRLQMGQ